MTIQEQMAARVAEYEKKISEVNMLCHDGTASEVEAKLSELSNVESEYLKLKEKEVFGSLPTMHDVFVMHHFPTISHKRVTSEGVMTGVEKVDKQVVINLKSYCEYHQEDIMWWYNVQSLNKRLTMKVANSLGVSASEMREIDNSYSMDKLAEELDMGKTPTSNSQCVKHIQSILDELSPDEGKVNNYDLAYVMACYSKRNSKQALKVSCSKHAALLTVLTDVFHRVATNGTYSVDYKKKVTEATSATAPVVPEATIATPETASVASEPAA